jgi:hypothetical protein
VKILFVGCEFFHHSIHQEYNRDNFPI